MNNPRFEVTDQITPADPAKYDTINTGTFQFKTGDNVDAAFNQVLNASTNLETQVKPQLEPLDAISTLPVPEKVNDDYYSLPVSQLPTKGAFYPDITHIRIKRFGITQISNLFKARKIGSLRLLVSTVDSSLDGFSAFNLTEGDFQYIIYWHRLNSYKKNPLVVDFTCDNVQHISEVINKQQPEETLNNTSILNTSSFKEDFIDESKLEEFIKKFYDTWGLYLFPPRMEDVLEVTEKIENGEELDILEDYAKYINPGHIKDKVNAKTSNKKVHLRYELLKRLEKEGKVEPDTLWEIDEFMELCKHGVSEKVNVACKTCGHIKEVELVVDLLSFFRRDKRA